MKDIDKTKEQLIGELAGMRQRNAVLETSESERRQAEKELQGNYESFRAIFENLNNVIIRLDKYGKIVEVNGRLKSMFGYEPDEVIGKNFTKFNLFSIQELPKMVKLFADGIRGKVTRFTEVEIRRKDGSTFFSEISTGLAKRDNKIEGMIAVVREITERKRMEDRLRESEEKSRVFMETATDLMNITDKDGKFTYVNDSVVRTLGYSKEELIGMPITQLLSKESLEKDFKPNWGKFLANGEMSLETTLLTKEGKEIYCEMKAVTVYDSDGNFVGTRGVHRDITERKQTEEKLKEKTKALEQVNIRLQEVDRLKSIFLASMSHELRTPLNSIIGFTSLILQGMVGEINKEQREQLTYVNSSANHLLSLINDILDISKIEAGKVELSLEQFRLDDVLREVLETVSPTASLKGIEVIKDAPEGITLFSDRRRMKQVLLNLVSNAVKFTDQGSVRVAVRNLEDKLLEVRVKDTGIGIKREDMDKLFVPFRQVDDSLTKKHEGTGLGLYLSQKLNTLLGGDISVESEYGKGSEFSFTLPIKYRKEGRKK